MRFALGAGIAGLAGCACRRSATSARTSARATSSTRSWSWCSAASATAGTVYAALGLGVLHKFLEGWPAPVLAKIIVLVFIVVFIQRVRRASSPSRGRGRPEP